MGQILFIIGLIGFVLCFAGILVSWKVFSVQRKKTIEFIEKL